MFRPFRLVLMIVSLSLTLGFVGLRTSAPPAQAFGAASDWQMEGAFKLYGWLYELANKAPMPDLSIAFGTGPRQPEIGTQGFSESSMGRSLSDLRERQTGVRSGPVSYGDLVGEVEKTMKSMSVDIGGRPSGLPKAEARRIVVGQ